MKIESPLVSIIIPTYCAEKHIARCLTSIKNQSYKNIEIVVVDQSSSDNTINVAKKFTKDIIIREKPKFYSPPARSRNIGAAKAMGKYLYNLDSDMELPPCLIENCVEIMERNSYVGLIVHETDIPLNFWAACRALEKKCMIKDPYFEAARFVSKNAFDSIAGYDGNLGSGEDWDINLRLKTIGKIGYCNIFVKHHTGKKYLLENIKKMMDYGKTFDLYIKKHPALAKKQLTPFRKMYLKNLKLLLLNPCLLLGLGVLKFTEFSGAFIGLIRKR